ncbi:MAG: hypothetical protein PVG32_10745 [Anaerolineales bacterium]|jgi:hypothetical protein
MSAYSSQSPNDPKKDEGVYKCLDSRQITMIDEALQALGDFGEVRLIVNKGRLRFIVTHKSYDAYKWQPGSIADLAG